MQESQELSRTADSTVDTGCDLWRERCASVGREDCGRNVEKSALRSRGRERRRLLNSAAATVDPPPRKRRSYACRPREVEAELSEPTSKHHTQR